MAIQELDETHLLYIFSFSIKNTLHSSKGIEHALNAMWNSLLTEATY